MRLVLLLTLAAGACAAATIDVSVNNDGPPELISPGVFRWPYFFGIGLTMQFDAGSQFTIYDVKDISPTDLLAGLTSPAGWVGTVQMLGLPPGGMTQFDSPTLPNVTWTRTDPTPLLGNTAVTGFGITSNLPWKQTLTVAEFTNRQPDMAGNRFNVGLVILPAAVPEPSSVALIGIGLFALTYLRRFRPPA